jgi:hypothetical protein
MLHEDFNQRDLSMTKPTKRISLRSISEQMARDQAEDDARLRAVPLQMAFDVSEQNDEDAIPTGPDADGNYNLDNPTLAPRTEMTFKTMGEAKAFVILKNEGQEPHWETHQTDDSIIEWRNDDTGSRWIIYDHSRHGKPVPYED